MPSTKTTVAQSVISAAAALAVVEAARAYAEQNGWPVNIALVDPGGLLMAFVRMNGAHLHSIDIAIDKAYTAASFKKSTSVWTAALKTHSEGVRTGLPLRPRFVAFGGGLPIMVDGELIGGIGVSGASEQQDEAIAQAGIDALTQ